jgi:metallopeptidase MepB
MAATPIIPQAPLIFDATPESLIASTRERCHRASQTVEQVISNVAPANATFTNAIRPLIDAENERIFNDPPITFYYQVSPSEEIREASREAERMLSLTTNHMMEKQELYDLVAAILENPLEMQGLSAESIIYLSRLHYTLIECGFGIPAGREQDRFREIRARIANLKVDINKNFGLEKEGIWLTRDDLEGLPDEVLAKLKQGESDRYWLELSSWAAFSVRSDVVKAATRKVVCIKDAERCPGNSSLVRELFLLRDEASRLIGYPSHAAFRLQPNLVSTPEKVLNFLEEFRRKISPHLQLSMQKLVEIKKAFLANHPKEPWDDPEKIFLWDISFYRRLYEKEAFQYDGDKIKEYFALEKVVPDMLNMIESLFQIRFENVEAGGSTSLTWHEDVLMYRVWHAEQRGGAFMGYFYYDLYKRLGKSNKCVAFSLQKVSPIRSCSPILLLLEV